MRIVKLQCTPYVVAEAVHEPRPSLVALTRAPIDDPTPNLMAILLKLPLDDVCVVESCFAVWRVRREGFFTRWERFRTYSSRSIMVLAEVTALVARDAANAIRKGQQTGEMLDGP